MPPEGGKGGMGGSILGASEDGSDLRLTAAGASVVQQESFPPYFGRGEQSTREGGRGNTVLKPSFLGRWWWYEDKKGCHFKLRDLGPTTQLLGMEIHRDRPNCTLSLSQSQFITNLL